MSRYQVDKLLRSIVMHEEVRDKFRQDPHQVLAAYDLTEEERKAIVNIDYATLYGQGVYPLLLFQWAKLFQPDPNVDIYAFMREYCLKVKPYGYPDFST